MICLFISVQVFFAQAVEVSADASNTALERHYGFLLCRLDIERENSKLVLHRRGASKSAKINIALKKGQKYLLLPLRKGDYKAVSVEAPFFSYPYVMDVKDDPAWSFTIEEHKTNYIGELVVKGTRTRNVVNIKLYNRIASHHDDIKKQYSAMLVKYPLRPATSMRDDFWEVFNGK